MEDQTVNHAGTQSFVFSGERLPAGLYYYRIEFPKGKYVIVARRMLMVR